MTDSKYSTPIADFLTEYGRSEISRLHMPGHKGNVSSESFPGFLRSAFVYDITEITGADDLYSPNGIIRESEENASAVYGAKTFYSAEGSSLSVKAMLYLALKHFELNHGPLKENVKPYIISIGKCHKAFFHAVELLDIKNVRIATCTDDVLFETLSEAIEAYKTPPIGIYMTYPDYFGAVTDIKVLKEKIVSSDIPVLVDGAHSAYFKFLDHDKYPCFIHPVDAGADMAVTSAHKTLPALTGASYLHVSDMFKDVYSLVNHALDLFGSSSPSYLILASLDAFNGCVGEYSEELKAACEKVASLKAKIRDMGFDVSDSEPLKTVVYRDKDHSGIDMYRALKAHKCEPEAYDDNFVIMMFSPYNDAFSFDRIEEAFKDLKAGRHFETGDDRGYNIADSFG